MFCSKCGKELREGALFCQNCGARVEANTATSSEGENLNPQIDVSRMSPVSLTTDCSSGTFSDAKEYGFFTSNGRIGRKGYIIWNLFFIFIYVVASYLGEVHSFLSFFACVVLLSTIILDIKRLHDMNMSGWWELVSVILYMTIVLAIVPKILLAFIPGTKGLNRFGKIQNFGF